MSARGNPLVAGLVLALALVIQTLPAALAQEATPAVPAAEATPAAAAAVARPVHIHTGDCVELGEVVAPLTDLTAPVGTGVGQAAEAAQAESSFTANVPLTLDAILASDHAINAHLSADEIDTYIACGELGGIIDANGALVVGLRESSGSGFTGVAYLLPNVDGVSTDVSVFIAPVLGAAG